jgi:hypothetical protein
MSDDVPAFEPPIWNPGIAVSASGLAVVVGSGFVGSSQIMVDGTPIQTGFGDTQHLSTYLYGIPPGQHRIVVSNPSGGGSKEQLLQIQKTIP